VVSDLTVLCEPDNDEVGDKDAHGPHGQLLLFK
jgi:hypothetical protein